MRQALEALYAGDEATALGLVRDIARSSPVSEWKLLVRGLAAFYRGDHGETQANWDRLDPERAPLRIARHLQNLHQGQSEKDAGGTDFAELESLVYGERILPRLRELSDLVAKNRWADVLTENHIAASQPQGSGPPTCREAHLQPACTAA